MKTDCGAACSVAGDQTDRRRLLRCGSGGISICKETAYPKFPTAAGDPTVATAMTAAPVGA